MEIAANEPEFKRDPVIAYCHQCGKSNLTVVEDDQSCGGLFNSLVSCLFWYEQLM